MAWETSRTNIVDCGANIVKTFKDTHPHDGMPMHFDVMDMNNESRTMTKTRVGLNGEILDTETKIMGYKY